MRIESSNCSLTYFIKSFRTLNGNFYSVENFLPSPQLLILILN